MSKDSMLRQGGISQFTGISSPYEKPENPEMIIHTDSASIQECVSKIIAYLEEQEVLNNLPKTA